VWESEPTGDRRPDWRWAPRLWGWRAADGWPEDSLSTAASAALALIEGGKHDESGRVHARYGGDEPDNRRTSSRVDRPLARTRLGSWLSGRYATPASPDIQANHLWGGRRGPNSTPTGRHRRRVPGVGWPRSRDGAAASPERSAWPAGQLYRWSGALASHRAVAPVRRRRPSPHQGL
jgi:hypothetical protein